MSGGSTRTSVTKKGNHHAILRQTNESQFTRRVGVGVMPRLNSFQMEEMRNLEFRMGSGSISWHPTIPKERLLAQEEVFQSLLDDNHRLAAVHVALKQEVAAVQKDLQQMKLYARTLKAEKDAELSDLYDKSVKMELDLREAEIMKAELVQLVAEIKQLTTEKQEIASQVQMMSHDLTRISADLQQVQILKAEIESLTEEIQCGRETIEYERKVDAENYERWQEMEKDLVSMSEEIKMLRTEISNAEKRARAIAVANAALSNPVVDHNANYHNPNVQSTRNSYLTGCGKCSVNHYAIGNAYPTSYNGNPVHPSAEINPNIVPSTSWSMSNIQHAQGPR